jgi:hypothetical protein
LALGIAHPDILLEMLSSHQIAEWMAYNKIEPFGERSAWLQTGIIASVIANAHRGKKGKVFKPEDFMPSFEVEETKPQSMEEQRGVLKQIFGFAKKHGLTKKE